MRKNAKGSRSWGGDLALTFDNVHSPDCRGYRLLRRLLVRELSEVLLRFREGRNRVLEALLRQAKEVTPGHCPDGDGAMLGKPQDAMLSKVGALLEFGEHPVLVVQHHLDRALDQEEHRVPVLAGLVEEIAR